MGHSFTRSAVAMKQYQASTTSIGGQERDIPLNDWSTQRNRISLYG